MNRHLTREIDDNLRGLFSGGRIQTGRRRIDSRVRRLQGRPPQPPDPRQQLLLPKEGA